MAWEARQRNEFVRHAKKEVVEANKMRTTLTIDPDVEILLKDAVSTQRKTLDEVANDAIRRVLARERSPHGTPYVLTPRDLGIRSEIGAGKMSRLSEELEDQEIIRKLREGR